ncbi:MAG: hypothetical protein MK209_07030 [Planctomycetes bacterium]|nr:hypothetical protein [Planctomycetota bacterium]
MNTIFLTLLCGLFTWGQHPEAEGAEAKLPMIADEAGVQEKLPGGESRMILLEELNVAPPGVDVTVLFVFERAEAVSASSSVSRSFQNARAIRVQADARSNSVFVSGAAEVVREAIVRMRALDEATPDAPQRPVRQKPGPAEGPMGVIEDYGASADRATSRAGSLIAGLVGLVVLGVLLVRRWVS